MKRRNFLLGLIPAAFGFGAAKAATKYYLDMETASTAPLPMPKFTVSGFPIECKQPGKHWNANHPKFRSNWPKIKVGDFVHVDKTYPHGEYKFYVVTKAHPEHLTLERQKKSMYREEIRVYKFDGLPTMDLT